MKTTIPHVLGVSLLFFAATFPAAARPIVAIRGINELIQFDSDNPGTITSAAPITGLVAGDVVNGIDFRPATGVLYALGINGTNGRIYTINTASAVATQVGPGPFSTTLTNGTHFGFDFNPAADRIRIVNDADQSLRVNSDTGALVGIDTNLDNTGGAGTEEVVAAAYDRNDRNPTTPTTLFGIDFRNDLLVRIGGIDGNPSPNQGAVTTIGPLGLTTSNENINFDITDSGTAFVSLADNTAPTRYRLYTINLASGALTPVGLIGAGTAVIRAMAAVPNPVANVNSGEFFSTITAAVNDAQTANGHTITVNAGTYPELVTVNKSLIILGARAGVDARDPARGTNESIVKGLGSGTSSFVLTANSVTIDGFTVQDNTDSAQFGAGIVLSPNTTTAKIRNNIIKNNVNGLFLSGNTPKIQTIIQRNLFLTNNQPGTISGYGIYTDQNKSGGTLSNVLIDDNTFSGNAAAAVAIESTAVGSQSRVVISNNIMTGNANGVVLSFLTDSVLARNTITSSDGSQVVVAGSVNDLSITENVIEAGLSRGIRVGPIFGPANANITATCNSIEGNGGAGLEIEPSGYTGSFNATGNWWGSATGPTIASNLGGTGQTLVDSGAQANYSGFLVSGDDQQPAASGFQCYPSATVYGVDSVNNLFWFDSAAPETLLGTVAITGMQAGENIQGIDFRPTTGELFALGSNNRLYVINPVSGAATLRAALTASATDATDPFTALAGTSFGVDFNPVSDLAATGPSFRVVSNVDQNLRIDAGNGQVTTDADINPAAFGISAVAYTNVDFDPATGTTLLGYDFSGDNFVVATIPNNGTYAVLGLSGVTGLNRVSMDNQTLPNARNIPLAAIQVGTAATQLYLVSLTNGLITPLGDIGTGLTAMRGLAVGPAGTFQLSAPSYSVSEAGPTATITINRFGGSSGAASIRFKTADGTANAPGDYTSVDQVVSFAAGETSKTVSIPIVNDSDDENNETINLSLSEPGGGAFLGGQATAVLTITDNDVITPVLSTQPSSPTAAVGEAIFDTVSISGGSSPSGTITFQLFGPNDNTCSGAPIFTSTVPVNGNGNYISGSFTPTAPGAYIWVVSYSGDPDHNAPVTTGCGAPGQTVTATLTGLGNISTRLRVETGDNVLIGGFIITGTQPKKVLIRAIGPSLAQFFSGVLENPTLELYQGNTLLESNDNWVDAANKQEIVDTTIPPTNDLESAIVMTLPANNTGYTAVVRGFNGGTGIGVVEAYDLDRLVDSELANISTRGFVQTDDNVLIAGTIVVGQNTQRVLIRAIGPSLAQFFSGVLENPTLELRDANGGLIQANDNWVDSADKQAIIDTTIAPTNDFESAIVAILPADGASYTAIVRGVNNTIGIAVVEVYALP